MKKITPHVGIKGIFKLTEPWVANAGEQYEITAIRTLSELSRTGVNPQKSLYGVMGLVDGKGTFIWSEEEKANPFIITLTGTNGNVITVPDTYIEMYPDTSMITYQRVIFAIDAGMYPSDETLDLLAKDLSDLCTFRTKIPATTKQHRVPMAVQPTMEEHMAYTRMRKYESPEHTTNAEELLQLRNEVVRLRQTNEALIKRLEMVGILP